MHRPAENPLVAIACGGTGGHLFPGLAVAGELQRRDCDVLLLVSPKDVDQQAVRAARELQVATPRIKRRSNSSPRARPAPCSRWVASPAPRP